MNVNETLRKLRENRHLQVADVANAIGISRQGYNNYETGSRNPSLDTIVKLAKFYNVSTDYILGVSDLEDDSSITENDIKMTDEKAEKLLQSFLQLPDSIKVGVMQWLESTITVLDNEVKPLTQTQLQLIESYKNQDLTITQATPQSPPQPVEPSCLPIPVEQPVVIQELIQIETSEQKPWRMAARSADGKYTTRTLTPEEVELIDSLEDVPKSRY